MTFWVSPAHNRPTEGESDPLTVNLCEEDPFRLNVLFSVREGVSLGPEDWVIYACRNRSNCTVRTGLCCRHLERGIVGESGVNRCWNGMFLFDFVRRVPDQVSEMTGCGEPGLNSSEWHSCGQLGNWKN